MPVERPELVHQAKTLVYHDIAGYVFVAASVATATTATAMRRAGIAGSHLLEHIILILYYRFIKYLIFMICRW